MKKTLLLLLFGINLLIADSLKTDISLYGESYKFTNSTIKKSSVARGFIADVKDGSSHYKVGYEHEMIDTKQPPLQDDFKISKLYIKYDYKFSESWKLNINYIKVLNDNIFQTLEGAIYGLGLGYSFNKNLSLNLTQFYTDYEDFSVNQSDIKITYKTKIDNVGIRIQSITKVIHLDNYKSNKYAKNADSDYFTSGLKVGAKYNSYFGGIGAFFGERAFAIMSDGFKIQHHPLSFNKTYAAVAGKNFSRLRMKLQYIYLRATELPAQQENVEVDILRLVANYRF